MSEEEDTEDCVYEETAELVTIYIKDVISEERAELVLATVMLSEEGLPWHEDLLH